MESSSLNKAHQQHRFAEHYLKHKKYAEAIECHQKAIEFLKESLQLTDNPRSIESIKLQLDYHYRQKEIILIKKEQFENYLKAIENKRNKLNNSYPLDEYKDSHQNESTSLQVAIYKNMEEADSLLGYLIKKTNGGNSDSESLKSFSTTDTDDKPVTVDAIDNNSCNAPIGNKHPKADSVVIEELRFLNEQLHALVYRLVTQLDASSREVALLKNKITQLESEKHTQDQPKSTNNLKVVNDSSGSTSPYLFSPSSELSPDNHDSRVLPVLAPLEMPIFDFSSFIKNSSKSVSNGN